MTHNVWSKGECLKQIMVATDGSEFSDGAIRTAIALARQAQAKLYGMSVAVYNPEYSTLVPNLEEEAQIRAEKALSSFNAAVGDLKHETVIRDAADPYRAILDASEELNADLVVVGRRGKRNLARMMVGDATAKVVGHAYCPVLVCPRAARLWEHRILLATDGSSFSEAAADAALHMANGFKLPVTVVSVVTASHSQARRKEADEVVARKVERLATAGIQAEGRIEEGRPDEAIIRAAEAVGADLIIAGSHGRSGLKKILLGSVTERVIGQAACPVLVVKP